MELYTSSYKEAISKLLERCKESFIFLCVDLMFYHYQPPETDLGAYYLYVNVSFVSVTGNVIRFFLCSDKHKDMQNNKYQDLTKHLSHN